MLNMTLLIDHAKSAAGLRSDRALSAALGLSPIAVHHWRSGRVLPSDATMMKLCGMAGLDAANGLLALNIARSEGLARATYWAIADRLQGDLRPFLRRRRCDRAA